MKEILTPLEMKTVDNNTAYNGIPTLLLMENAGSKIADYIIRNYPDKKKVSIYAGTGGNGGDGFVIARHLLNYDYRIKVFLLARAENIKNNDSKINFDALRNVAKADKHLQINIITDSTQIKPDNSDIIVDAILGTGVKGKIREPISSAIDTINYSPAIVISVDVPSGLDPLTGVIEDKSVIPAHTLTLHKKKWGLIEAQSTYTGQIDVLDIGIPKVSEKYVGDGNLLEIPKPDKNSHKGQNGSVLIVGSSPKYVGAVIFAAQACARMGVDLIYIVAPKSSADIIKQYNPEYIVEALESDVLDGLYYHQIRYLIDKVDSILLGSGADLCEKTANLYYKIIDDAGDKNIILDADALKILDCEKIKHDNLLVTPHKREFESYFKIKLENKLEDNIELLKEVSSNYNTSIVLKGTTDIIVSSDEYKLNDRGNQGMTKGGSGDILAGLITALSTKMDLFNAAYISTYIISKTADEVLEKKGFNYTSTDIIDAL